MLADWNLHFVNRTSGWAIRATHPHGRTKYYFGLVTIMQHYDGDYLSEKWDDYCRGANFDDDGNDDRDSEMCRHCRGAESAVGTMGIALWCSAVASFFAICYFLNDWDFVCGPKRKIFCCRPEKAVTSMRIYACVFGANLLALIFGIAAYSAYVPCYESLKKGFSLGTDPKMGLPFILVVCASVCNLIAMALAVLKTIHYLIFIDQRLDQIDSEGGGRTRTVEVSSDKVPVDEETADREDQKIVIEIPDEI